MNERMLVVMLVLTTGGACGGEDPAASPDGDGDSAGSCAFFEAPQPGLFCLAKDGGYRCCGTAEEAPEGGQTVCYYAADGSQPAEPAAQEWYDLETRDEGEAVHVRVAFAEWFVDNTYGANASRAWGTKGHKFRDLVGSDHLALGFRDATGATLLSARFDYISQSAATPSGYANLGALGGDGGVLSGPVDAVRETLTSLDRNLNERGCVFTEDSPGPSECADWDAQVVYEAWVRADLFDPAGFGGVDFESVHASPSATGENTVEVTPGACPPS
jgi:hypothetical protein